MTITRAITKLDALIISKSKTIGSSLASNIRNHLRFISEQVDAMEKEVKELDKRHAKEMADMQNAHALEVAAVRKAAAEAHAANSPAPIDPLEAQIKEILDREIAVADALSRIGQKPSGG